MAENNNERILTFLRQNSNAQKKFSVGELKKSLEERWNIKLSREVISKCLNFLESEGKIKTDNSGGQIRFYYI